MEALSHVLLAVFKYHDIFFLSVKQAPDFDYDFSGFKRLIQLLATSCTNIEQQVQKSGILAYP